MRAACSLMVSLSFVVPAHAQSFNYDASSNTYVLAPGSYGRPASIGLTNYYNAVNQGSFSFSTTPSTHNAIAVDSAGGSPDSYGFTFTNQGPVTITAPSSDTGASDFRILNIFSLGTDKSHGNSPDPGGASGPITLNLGSSVSFTSQIASFAYGAYGVWVQSLGGRGDTSDKEGVNGANGGVAGAVAAAITGSNVSVQVPSAATGAAIRIEQIGGQGGEGNNDGRGGTGGTALAQTITLTDSRLTASGPGVAGLVVRQIGGQGGNGGLENNEQNSPGGAGGTAAGISLTLAQGSGGPGNAFTTSGASAPALSILTQGGSGGIGASTGGGVQFNSLGGNGGQGSSGGPITLGSSGTQTVTTSGASSPGILAVSQGGVGGAGGKAEALSGGISGSGGSGGSGGNINSSLGAGLTVRTSADGSPGIALRSLGGVGGLGGVGDSNVDIDSGNGGGGGGGGFLNATVDAGVSINTTGSDAYGVVLQSVGAQGGAASKATGLVTTAGNGGNGGGSSGFYFLNNGQIATFGANARGILAQSLSGDGGPGANADALSGKPGAGGSPGGILTMTVLNAGSISTAGASAQGLLAQSIGGGGGAGGNGSGFFTASGGAGLVGASGGIVFASNSGSIVTTGATAAGLLAQSIGGGGGAGGSGSAVISSQGGSGGPGGGGGDVTTTLGGGISTSGELSHGAVAQSIGGGGGTGGNATAAGVVATYTLGGSGGGGGNGGPVATTAQGVSITTTGSGADGILAQSIGGGGGAGGGASSTTATGGFSFAAAVGGSGGDGGDGGAVNVALGNTTIKTGGGSGFAPPVDAIGVLAQSIGGGGGSGGGANALAVAISRPSLPDSPTLAISAAYANGGTGGGGGKGGDVVVDLGSGAAGTSGGMTIRTAGAGSHGAMAQSIGGGGGQGGDSSAMAATIGSVSQYGPQDAGSTSVTLSLAMGGSTISGGTGGAANVNAGNNGPVSVTTTGDYAFGLVAQSIGGGGGNAGVGSARLDATGNATKFGLSLSLGSQGGDGGDGGQAGFDIASGATVRTFGSGSIGALAQSIGGGGGTATGGTLEIGEIELPEGSPVSGTVSSTISLGRAGGSAGSGGAVSVTSSGTVTTIGNDAPAVLAQSIGGGGGIGGSAGTDAGGAAEGNAMQLSRTRASTSRAQAAEASSDPDYSLKADLKLSVGGTGGTAGNGGSVVLAHSGQVATSGDYAPALVAQSIGGGGGRGGTAVANGADSGLSYSNGKLAVNTNLSLGGAGGTSGSGGTVTIDLVGGATVTTGLAGLGGVGSGVQSIGILAQSIGGGGGTGADGTAQANGTSLLGAGLSGGGGASGTGGVITLQQSGGTSPITITTSGESGHGIVLQSIGAGGGLAGAGSALPVGTATDPSRNVGLRLGGSPGSTGDGGNVTVDNPILTVRTSGMGAYGLIAQSIGGGGGLANISGSSSSLSGLGGQGSIGNGGQVSVNLPDTASISTTGLGAHGVVAQSVGGGGGIATGYQAGVTPSLSNAPQFGTSTGNGGNVSVLSLGTITTTGPGAFGIIAQSVARGGGLATIGSQFYAASTGNPGGSISLAGSSSVTLQGRVSAIGENGVGVFAQSVNGQNLSAGTVTVNLGFYAPAAVMGGSGQGAGVWIDSGNSANSMYVGQGSSISALSNLAITYTGGSGVNVTNDGTITGSTRLGSGTLTNRGTLNPSADGMGRAVIAGDFVQTSAGRLTTQADFVRRTAGQFVVTGDAALAGTVQTSLASVVANVPVPVLTVQGRATGSLTAASTALFDFAVVPSGLQSGQRFDLVATGSHLSDARFALTPGRQAVAGYLDRVFAAGAPQFGTLFATLDRTAASPGNYRQQLAQLSPRSSLSVGALRAQDAAFMANATMSCPVFGATTSFLTEGNCTYARIGGRASVVNGDEDRGRLHADSTVMQIGGQGEVAPGWFLGGSLAYETGRLNANDDMRGGFDVGHGVLTLKRQEGPWLLTGAVFGSVGNIDLRRTSSLPGFAGVAAGSTTPITLGGRVRAAYTMDFDNLYLRPFLNIDAIHTRLGSYSEAGLGGLGLRHEAADQTTAVFTSAVELGMRTDLNATTVLRSFVSAGVDARTDAKWRTTTRLIGAPAGVDGFTTVVPQDRAAARVSAGVQLLTGDRMDLRAQYDGSFSDKIKTHGGFLTFSYRM